MFSLTKYLFIILFSTNLVHCLTPRQKFIDSGSSNEKCSILFPSLIDNYLTPSFKTFFTSLKDWIRKVNCTPEVINEYSNIGSPDENGTYDGIIGMIQRNEANSFIFFIRPDALPYEPTKIGPVLFPADAVISSKKKLKVQQTRDVLSVFIDVGMMMYIYTAYFMLIVSILITAEKRMHGSKEYFLLTMIKSFFEQLNVMFCVAYSCTSPKLITRKILLQTMSVFSLIFIIGLLQNRVGSDLCVFFGEDDINSITDLINDKKVVPWVTPRFFLYNVLKSSPEGTENSLLWKRIMENPDVSIEETFEDKYGGEASIIKTVTLMMNQVSDGKIATLISEFLTKTSRIFGCRFQRKIVSQTVVSTERFAPGTFSIVWSHETAKYYLNALNYMFTTSFETGCWDGFILSSKHVELPITGKANRETIRCQDSIVQNDLEWEPFDMNIFVGIFGFLATGCSLALVSLTIEKVL